MSEFQPPESQEQYDRLAYIEELGRQTRYYAFPLEALARRVEITLDHLKDEPDVYVQASDYRQLEQRIAEFENPANQPDVKRLVGEVLSYRDHYTEETEDGYGKCVYCNMPFDGGGDHHAIVCPIAEFEPVLEALSALQGEKDE